MKQTVFARGDCPAAAPKTSRPVSKPGLRIAIWLSTLVLMFGVGAFSYVQLKNIKAQQLERVENTLANLARVNEEHALRTFRAADQTLRFMMTEYADEGEKLDLGLLVRQGVIDGSLFAQIGIIDAQGIFRLSNLPFTKGLDLSDREHFKVHKNEDTGELFISKPVLGRASGKSSIQLTRRINRPDGSFGGVAVVSIDATYFTHFYSDLDLPEKSVAALVGLDGVIRARQLDEVASFGEVITKSPTFQYIRDGKSSGQFTSFSAVDGVERIYAYRKITDYPLAVTIGIATETLAGMFTPGRNALLIETAVLCFLLLAMASALTFYTLRLEGELGKRQRIAVELRTSEERLELALIGGELGAWEWNLKDEAFTSNAQLFTLIGYEPGELKFGKGSLLPLFHPQDLSPFLVSLKQHLKGESKTLKCEFRLLHKQGGWIWISLMSKVIERDPAGRAVRLSGTAHDVTSRVEVTQMVAENEERWKTAISGANEGIWDWSVATGGLFVSRALGTILGYTAGPSSVTLKDWTVHIHPDDIAEAYRQIISHFKGQTEFYRVEMRLRCKDGAYKWMLIRGRASFDKAGRAVRFTGSASDITDQHLAQEQIQDRNEQLSAIFSLSPDAFVSFDHAFCVKDVNPAFEQLTGLAGANVIGLSEEKFTEQMNGRCAASRPFCGLVELRRLSVLKARKGRGVIELASPVRRVLQAKLKTSGAASVSQILYLRDITHETIVEDMKTEFLSTAAHELRTPMASILGFAEVMLTHKLDEPQRLEFSNIIHTQSQQMSSILDELLDLARIEARKEKDFVFETLDLQTIVGQVVRGFGLPAGRAAPRVAIPSIFFHADRGKAKQAILNVLSNAYKYSSGGDVEITLVESSGAGGAPLVGICVRDHGIGMEKAHLERVFERFYRADRSGKTPGTGLGMSIVKEIMRIHRGKISLDSKPGEGTSVTLLFPCVPAHGLHEPSDASDWMKLAEG
ncbi:PAS domain-containing protein [Polaromonas sp. YR568]|uniref:PAS domain-containing protein n=1 Tax=Polaromonas sp. YR568 TaxID=1855301 RepID=UPI00398C04B7